jgi:hypothetical protein
VFTIKVVPVKKKINNISRVVVFIIGVDGFVFYSSNSSYLFFLK